jgi:hypothetical protein
MKKLKFIAIALLIAGTAVADHHEETLAGAVLDDFHDAAAHGDKDRYLGHMTDDAVFMGTDEWERWPKNPDFVDYVNSRFKDGAGWNYQSVERKMVIADNADTAWFDEVVFSESNGRFRGTGVLVKQGGQWKIAHYAMSFLVFNENWQEVIELTKKTRAEKENP